MEPVNQMEGARLSEYTPESIREVAEVLAPQAKNYINAIGEQVGQAQQSMGPLAAQVMGESKTAGVGNYTYNRLARPQVDAMRDQILVQGYTDALIKCSVTASALQEMPTTNPEINPGTISTLIQEAGGTAMLIRMKKPIRHYSG